MADAKDGVLIHRDSVPGIKAAVDMARNFIPGRRRNSVKRVFEQSRKCRWEFRILFMGGPDSGGITVPMRVKNDDGFYVTQVIPIPFNSSVEALKAALSIHPLVSVDDVDSYSTGAALPQTEIAFWFKSSSGIKTKEVQFLNHTNSLGGGWFPYAVLRLGRG